LILSSIALSIFGHLAQNRPSDLRGHAVNLLALAPVLPTKAYLSGPRFLGGIVGDFIECATRPAVVARLNAEFKQSNP